VLPADPKASYLAHKEEIDAAIHRVLASGWYILGHEVDEFEQEFARYLDTGYAVGVASGTDALHLALRAVSIGPGDAVLTVSHTAVATVAAIDLAGAQPVLVDVDPATFTLDPGRLEDTIKNHRGPRLRGVIPVHLYGHPACLPAIREVATRYNLDFIEDSAQAHGAVIQGRKAGTWGDMAAFSFYPTKNLGGLGDGGAVVTTAPELAERLRLLREYGWRERYVSVLPGMNSRLDALQAAVLRVKLGYLDAENARRRDIARRYDSALATSGLLLPRSDPDTVHVYHQYVVRTADRDGLRGFLAQNSVGTAIHYPVPVHLQPAYRQQVIIGAGGLLHTERLCREILSLPMHPHLDDNQVDRVCEVILRWHHQKRRKNE
jgi:dTDP-4-amino-4,6-dideoxygalactose transaminase